MKSAEATAVSKGIGPCVKGLYMSENIVPILLITLTIVLVVILFIVVGYIYMRLRSLEQLQADSLGPSPLAENKGGSLSGFRGKAIWDALEHPDKHPGVIDQLSSRYAFVLARHIEQVIDQGQLDRQRNRESVPESSAPIGGLRGEVQSWLPQSYVQRFYRVGAQSLTATEEELAELRSEVRGLVDEILHKLNMTDQGRGIANLITSHTLDFSSQARGDEYDASEPDETQSAK
jgi:hypothetical protein